MNDIQELKNRRTQTILEKETLERELAPLRLHSKTMT